MVISVHLFMVLSPKRGNQPFLWGKVAGWLVSGQLGYASFPTLYHPSISLAPCGLVTPFMGNSLYVWWGLSPVFFCGRSGVLRIGLSSPMPLRWSCRHRNFLSARLDRHEEKTCSRLASSSHLLLPRSFDLCHFTKSLLQPPQIAS